MRTPCSTRGAGCISIVCSFLPGEPLFSTDGIGIPELLHYSGGMKFTAQGDEPCIKTYVSLHEKFFIKFAGLESEQAWKSLGVQKERQG